jgi:hypothetical protein
MEAQNSDRSNCPSFLQKDNLDEHAPGNGAAIQSGSGIFIEHIIINQLMSFSPSIAIYDVLKASVTTHTMLGQSGR